MARLRYVKTLEQVKESEEANPDLLSSTVRSVRVVYETDPAVAAAVVPKPLEPANAPEVCVPFSHVAIHISPDFTFEIGSAIFGVRAHYDGTDGVYLITMPMTTEAAVVGGRERYGEPKKIAEIDFTLEGDRVSSTVKRMGIPYLQVEGTLGELGTDLGSVVAENALRGKQGVRIPEDRFDQVRVPSEEHRQVPGRAEEPREARDQLGAIEEQAIVERARAHPLDEAIEVVQGERGIG